MKLFIRKYCLYIPLLILFPVIMLWLGTIERGYIAFGGDALVAIILDCELIYDIIRKETNYRNRIKDRMTK